MLKFAMKWLYSKILSHCSLEDAHEAQKMFVKKANKKEIVPKV